MLERKITDSPKKVLIVDDEESMRETLAAIFEAEGFEVVTAYSGDEAIRCCQHETFQGVLMDVRMPGINGLEAFRQIHGHDSGTRVILMSAYSTDDLKEAALDEGAIAFLPKPLDLENAISLIRDATERTVLVVENEEQTSRLLKQHLGDHGYRVTVADTPTGALDLVKQIRFDLIFVDVALPEMNGLELYLTLKQSTSKSIVIMIAGMDEKLRKLAHSAVGQNAYTVIEKPVKMKHVLPMLRRLIGHRMSGDQRKPFLG